MADFAELLALLTGAGEEGAPEVPETIYDDLNTAHELAVSSVTAELADKDAALQAAIAEADELRAKLFQYETETQGKDDAPADDEPDPMELTIEDLFE